MTFKAGQIYDLSQKKLTDVKFAIPGFLALEWFPTPGSSTLATSPASIVAKEVYARVRQVYSGSLDADAPDFYMYIMAMDSVYSFIASLKRVYRALVAYSPENFALPDGLLTALGFTPPQIIDLKQHRTQLWQITNELIHMCDKFKVPSSMDVFNRHYWMNDNVYTDAASANSQMYVFYQRKYYKYASLNTPQGDPAAGLTLVDVKTTLQSGIVDYLFNFGRELIEALVAWDDAYTIAGYMRRAYEDDPSFTIDQLAVDETLVPVYVEEVLMQIENSFPVIGSAYDRIWDCNITQDPLTNSVLSTPRVSMTYSASDYTDVTISLQYLQPRISIRSDTPSVTDSVVASRLLNHCSVNASTSTSVTYDIIAGTEILMDYVLVTGTGDPGGVWPSYVLGGVDITVVDGAEPLTQDQDYTSLPMFDWHPILWSAKVTTLGTTVAPLGDIHNLTNISVDALQNIHRICQFSEFNSFRSQ